MEPQHHDHTNADHCCCKMLGYWVPQHTIDHCIKALLRREGGTMCPPLSNRLKRNINRFMRRKKSNLFIVSMPSTSDWHVVLLIIFKLSTFPEPYLTVKAFSSFSTITSSVWPPQVLHVWSHGGGKHMGTSSVASNWSTFFRCSTAILYSILKLFIYQWCQIWNNGLI